MGNKEKTVQSLGGYIKYIDSITKKPYNENCLGEFSVSLEHCKKLYADYQKYYKNDIKKFYNRKHEIENFEVFHKELNQIYNTLFFYVSYNKVRLFYRGHYSRQYKLLPSVFREQPSREDMYYNEILTRCPNDFDGKSHLQKLVKMQHYECPTRLLDVTSNPLVALYFACQNTQCPKCNKKKTGEVLIFAVREKNMLRFDSDKALILSCLPKFSNECKYELYSYCIYCIMIGKEKVIDNGDCEAVGKLYHEIRREVPAFKDCISPWDILSIYLVQPYKDNSRIVKQDGAFIICGETMEHNVLEKLLSGMLVDRIVIQNKKKILNQLDALGINEASLFPEIDKVAHYLKDN